jgi:hypothetical protein
MDRQNKEWKIKHMGQKNEKKKQRNKDRQQEKSKTVGGMNGEKEGRRKNETKKERKKKERLALQQRTCDDSKTKAALENVRIWAAATHFICQVSATYYIQLTHHQTEVYCKYLGSCCWCLLRQIIPLCGLIPKVDPPQRTSQQYIEPMDAGKWGTLPVYRKFTVQSRV